jgi:1-acyl-sn-glycerol-3-phosphate acyltransferase
MDAFLNHPFIRPMMWGILQGLLLFLGVMSLGWNAMALLLYPLLSRQQGLRIGRATIAHSYAFFWRIASLTGLLKIDTSALTAVQNEPGLIIVANHPSMLDALLLVARLPRSACVMKASLMGNIFIGPGARLARYIQNDSPRGMIREAVKDLKAGGQLLLFPEGTRTTRYPLNAFRPGVALIAKLANTPIQTVFIYTSSPYLGKGWPLWRLPPLPMRFSVRLGQRFLPSKDADALLNAMECYMAANLSG